MTARRLYLLLCALLAGSVVFSPVENPDLYWHLAAARDMLRAGRVPAAEAWTWTLAGAPWIDFEWLSQLVYWGLWRAGGYAGLLAFKLALFAGVWFATLMTLRLYGVGFAGIGVALVAWALGLLPGMDVRPENFSLLFFAYGVLLLEGWRLGRLRYDRSRWLPLTAAVFCLWANLHGGFAFGMVLIGAYGVGRMAQETSWKPFREHLELGLAAIAGSLINPAGWDAYRVLLRHQADLPVMQAHLKEWGPVSIDNPWQWPFLVLVGATFGLVLYRMLKTRRIEYPHLIVLGYFALQANAYGRHTSFFVLFAVPALAWTLGQVKLPARLERERMSAIPALLALSGLFLSVYAWPYHFRGSIKDERYAMRDLAAYLEAERATLAPLKMFNLWQQGGYLELALPPEYQHYVDGRYLFHSFLPKLWAVQESPRAFKDFLDEEGIELVLLDRQPHAFPVEMRLPGGDPVAVVRPYFLFFLPTPDWALLHWDERGMVFVRRDRVPAGWLKGRELRWLRPGDIDYLDLTRKRGELPVKALEAELERLEKRVPGLTETAIFRNWLKK